MNPTLLEELVENNYKNLYRFALSLAKNEAEASDLTQQAFLLLASKGGSIRDLSKAKSWLFTCLRREFYALRKQSGRYTQLETDEGASEIDTFEAPENVELEVINRANAELIMEGLSEISEVFREPVTLFYLEDFSYKEIARILEIPDGTVMSRLARGRSELRSWLIRRLDADSLPSNVLPLEKGAENK